MRRYTLRDLFLVTTMIAVGVAVVRLLVRPNPLDRVGWPIWFCVYLVSGALIGAGLLAPFKKMKWGALLGLILICATIELIFLAVGRL